MSALLLVKSIVMPLSSICPFLVPDYHFHCYVTNGKIDVLSDSRVENVAVRMTWHEFMGIGEDSNE